MKISLKPAKGNKFVFSLLPKEVHTKYAAKYQSFDILSLGTVKVPRGHDVVEISWEGEFFGKTKRNMAGVDTSNWQPPNTCVRTLKAWMNAGTELTLIISGTWINMDVTIASFEASPHGAYGDVSYSIVFQRVRDLKIYTTKESKVGKKKKTKSRPKKKSSGSGSGSSEPYTVKTYDTLIGIASRKNTTWQKLYAKNKDVIESVAKKRGLKDSDHGHWIFPGTKLTIP